MGGRWGLVEIELLSRVSKFDPASVEFFFQTEIDLLLDVHVFSVIAANNVVDHLEVEAKICWNCSMSAPHQFARAKSNAGTRIC